MDLRTKLLLGIGIALVAAFTLVALFSAISMEASYERLERLDMEKTVETTMNDLRTDMKSTYSTTRDYSAWTATYRFAEGKNPDWVRENMGPDFFSRFAMDRVLIFNSTGSLIFSMEFNDTSLNIEPASGIYINDVERFNMAVNTIRSQSGTFGVLEASTGPALIAAHPILTDDYQGPAAGSILLARMIDEDYLVDLSLRSGHEVSVVPATEITGNASYADIAAQFTQGKPIATRPVDENTISGYIPLVDQQPPADYYLKVTKPRTIYATGMGGIATFLTSLAVAGVCIIIFVLIFIDRVVLFRLNRIIRTVRAKKAAGNLPLLPAQKGEDEISRIALAIDPVFTELAASREKMAESEERYRMLAESAQDIIFIIDRNDTVTYVNAFAAQAFGRPREEIIGKPRSALFPGPVGERQFRSLNQVLTSGEPAKIEGSLPLPTGEIWQDTLLVPIRDSHGTITAVMGISRDLTKRKQAEDALVTAHKKLTLISTITRHDILNQLTALATYLELSRDYAENESAKEFIGKELKIASMIDREINFTRDFEEMGAGAPVWHNVNATISGANRSLLAGKAAMEIGFSDIEIYADSLLEKVFYNLIDNAIRYGGPAMTTIRFSAREIDGALIIACDDNGVGIALEEKERIFEQGYGNHTGLGLFLCREILGITGITITETGIFGSGARFEIAVPQGKWRRTDKKPGD